jgi:hypothetical protein
MAAIGIILIIAGAVLAWGVSIAVDGANLQLIGYIVMAGGGLALVVAAIKGAGWMSMSNQKVHTERHVSADGQHYVEETKST